MSDMKRREFITLLGGGAGCRNMVGRRMRLRASPVVRD